MSEPMSSTTLENVQAESDCRNCKIQETLNTIIAEIRELRRERLPADPEKIRELLAAIYEIFEDAEFTAFDIFLECDGNNALRAAVSLCLKSTGKLTIRRLSIVLSKSVGRHGQYSLEKCDKTRIGRYYKIVME